MLGRATANAILTSQQRAQLAENAEVLNEAMAAYRASVDEEQQAKRTEKAIERQSSEFYVDTPNKRKRK